MTRWNLECMSSYIEFCPTCHVAQRRWLLGWGGTPGRCVQVVGVMRGHLAGLVSGGRVVVGGVGALNDTVSDME